MPRSVIVDAFQTTFFFDGVRVTMLASGPVHTLPMVQTTASVLVTPPVTVIVRPLRVAPVGAPLRVHETLPSE